MRGRGLHLDDDVPIVTPTVQQTGQPADAAEGHMSMGKMELISNAAAKMGFNDCRSTSTADFGSSLRQVPNTSNLCLLEDKVQDRGMYLFTISYGCYAMDQRSGDG